MRSPWSGPGSTPLAGAGLLPPAQQDSVRPIHPVDSIAEPNLLGDTVTPIIQWIFQRPPWVMWGGVVLAGVLALFLLWLIWPRRRTIIGWVTNRSRGFKTALVGVAAAAVLVAAGAGFAGFHFMENDRRFCNGCHIFVPSGQVWDRPDTGSYTLVPQLEGKHDTINCHTCHPLKPFKEAVKLVFWMSGVRDEEIPEHAKVPRTICEDCHVQGAAKETWQAVAATAGHRAHFESDSSAVKDIECLTCHARTAHRFPPVNETCGQSGCHEESDTRIVLGKMSEISGAFHCAGCHEFVATVPALATRDSAAGALRPAVQQCFRCHEMKARLPDFDAARDPHGGTCGMCHNPHSQETPVAAKNTCASAGCHADWRGIPFHTGDAHRRIGQQCVTCHQPHAARVDASDCAGCHTLVQQQPGTRLRPPLPFDTTRALQQSRAEPPERPSKVKGDAPPGDDPPPRPLSALPPLPSDTFSHDRHQSLTCITCHVSPSGRGRLTFESPRGCQICHHQAPARSECAQCHAADRLATPATIQVTVRVPRQEPRARPVPFRHDGHGDLACVQCHTTAVSLTAADSVASCQACHADHHETARNCAACHRTGAIQDPHRRPVQTHTACDACHTPQRIAALVPGRSFCLSCHETEQDHYGPTECTVCHFLVSPEDHRRVLLRPAGGPG